MQTVVGQVDRAMLGCSVASVVDLAAEWVRTDHGKAAGDARWAEVAHSGAELWDASDALAGGLG
ncbi:RING-type E3 ubiquitin transferase [Psidium guajava]|nr:RING-type E3 ubiquitin transferase [Psidium guajava]